VASLAPTIPRGGPLRVGERSWSARGRYGGHKEEGFLSYVGVSDDGLCKTGGLASESRRRVFVSRDYWAHEVQGFAMKRGLVSVVALAFGLLLAGGAWGSSRSKSRLDNKASEVLPANV